MEQALALEAELKTRFYSKPRESAENIEQLKEEYYTDFTEWVSESVVCINLSLW